MTNCERIKAMSIEDMACGEEYIKIWLESEVEEE